MQIDVISFCNIAAILYSLRLRFSLFYFTIDYSWQWFEIVYSLLND